MRRTALRRLAPALLVVLAACGKERPADEHATASAPPAAPPASTAPVPNAATPSPSGTAATPPAAAPVAVRTAAKPALISDAWYRTLVDGQSAGWRHVKWTRSTFDGRESVHDRTEASSTSTRQMGGGTDTFENKEITDLDRTEDGHMLRMLTRIEQPDRVTETTMTWTGKGYELVEHVAGLEEKHSVACDAPCPGDAEAFLSVKLQRGEIAVGQHLEYKSPNFEGKRLDTNKLVVTAREKLNLSTGTFDCFRVEETTAGAPASARTTWWFDDTGVFRKFAAGSTVIVCGTEREAREIEDGGAVYSITLHAVPEMPRCTSLDRAVVDVELTPRPGEELQLPDLPETPFSRELSRDGNVLRVELSAHDAKPVDTTQPITDPQLTRYLERTNLFCWDAPRVKSALAAAVGDEKDPEKTVRAILRHVFLTLRKASGPIPQPTALEILEDGGGDCSEHCVLFVALCRGAGIPTRRLSGYAQVGDMWGAHSFAEVWLGRWIGCDPTTNEFGTKARYIAFGWDDDADSFPGAVSSIVRGRMKIRTVEFSEGARTWKVDAKRDPASREDPLSGLAFAEPPSGWAVRMGPSTGQARVTGPGVRADISTDAGMGDLTCDMYRRMQMPGSKPVTFAGQASLRSEQTTPMGRSVSLLIPYRRRSLTIRLKCDDQKATAAALATLEKVLAPTFE